MTTYFAFVHKDEDSAYGIVFPDVPGCFSAGDTFEQAVRNAAEALRLHVETLRDLGRPVPQPRGFEALMADSDVRAEAEQAPFIAVPLDLGHDAIEVSVQLQPDLLDAIDAAACRAGVSRSQFLAEAARQKIAS